MRIKTLVIRALDAGLDVGTVDVGGETHYGIHQRKRGGVAVHVSPDGTAYRLDVRPDLTKLMTITEAAKALGLA